MDKMTLETLLANKSFIHVIGITAYRTAREKDFIFECKRDDIAFLENQVKNKDNHVVLIFQILFGQFAGIYYAFLTDDVCLVGKDIKYEEF